MIKIIKKPDDIYYAKCVNCGCIFTYELADMMVTGRVECPHCHDYVSHNPDHSKEVKKELEDEKER